MTAAVVVAAGRGERLGPGTPKGLRELGGQPLYAYSLDAAQESRRIARVVLVVPGDSVEDCHRSVDRWSKVAEVVAGGDRRQESVLRGIAALPPEMQWVAVHDGARPFVTADLLDRVIDAAILSGGAIAARPASDTLKRVADGRVLETIDRSGVWHAETPQVFPRDRLLAALTACLKAGATVTDEAEAMERAGHPIRIVAADQENRKINTPDDWRWAEEFMRRRSARGSGPSSGA